MPKKNNLGRPIMTEAQTSAAIANLSLQGMVKYDESGEFYCLTDKGLDHAYEIFETHSDEEKALMMTLFQRN